MEGTALVHVYTLGQQILLLIFHGTPECIAGSSQLHCQQF